MYTSKFFSFIAGVVDTAYKLPFAKISANFRKKIETVQMGYSGAQGKLNHDINLKLKISRQTTFH